METPFAQPESEARTATAPQVTSGAAATSRALWRGMRPKHWVKNGFVLAGFLFTLDRPGVLERAWPVAIAVACFCLVASSIYLVNDVCDAAADRLHPKKRQRPIASGALSPRTAVLAAVILAVVGAGASFYLGWAFTAAVVGYVLLSVSYSLWLKHLVILDVMTVSTGFVIRAAAGAVAIGVEISPWLLICTLLIALLLSFAKRRSELALVDQAVGHRRILERYTLAMLDQMITIVAAATLMAYTLYTFLAATAMGRPALMLTVPFVFYGIFRFLYLAHRQQAGGIEDLLKDRGILLTVLLWAGVSGVVLTYGIFLR